HRSNPCSILGALRGAWRALLHRPGAPPSRAGRAMPTLRGGRRSATAPAATGRRTLPLMCGIVGYVGEKQAQDVVIEGLRRLEYRGYDSAGVALVADGRVAWAKKAGKLANLEKQLSEVPLP